MPVEVAMDVWGSTLREHTHKGPNQAGNKSLLSYRADIGVPGYTGFIPGPSSIVLPTKNFEHTGKPVDAATHDLATTATVEPTKSKVSEYIECYRLNPQDTKPFSKTGGGYFLAHRKLPASPPFIASTTYRSEVLNGAEGAAAQVERSLGLKCTIAQYEPARRGMHKTLSPGASPHSLRSQSADPGPRGNASGATGSLSPTQKLAATARPHTAVTNQGELVGYQTTNQAMLVPNPLTGGPAAPGAVLRAKESGLLTGSPRQDQDSRYQTMPRAMPPGLYGTASSYRRDFGEECSDPMERSAPNERFQTRLATTRELSDGSTRNTNHLPGYTGHCSAYKYNELARAQSDAADDRINAKNDMTLYALDQFSRTRLPGYTGYKPQDARNITLEQPSHGPTALTTSGAAAHQATKRGVPPVDNSYYINSRAGLMTFFSSTGEHVSDNGLSNAQQYYKVVRPGDGRFNMGTTSKTTTYGAPFNARSSLV